jgi:hypothetical protein
MLRKSLKLLCETDNVTLPDKWQELRPEQLSPEEFLSLTADLYGLVEGMTVDDKSKSTPSDRDFYVSETVWRTSLHGHKKKNYEALEGRF